MVSLALVSGAVIFITYFLCSDERVKFLNSQYCLLLVIKHWITLTRWN